MTDRRGYDATAVRNRPTAWWCAQRRAGRPFRFGQDNSGRGAAEARPVCHPAMGPGGRGNHRPNFDEVEIRQQRVVNLTSPAHPLRCQGEPAGYPGLRRLHRRPEGRAPCGGRDPFAVAATEGVDGLTRMLWDECAAVGMPRAVVITKIDHQRGDFEQALSACRAAFGDSVAPLYLPVGGAGTDLQGLIRLLSGRMFDYSSGTRTERDPDAALADQVEEIRGTLIEGIIQESEDENLMDSYLSGEEIVPEEPDRRPGNGRSRGARSTPVLAASAPHGGRDAGASRGHHPGFPLARGASAADRHLRGRQDG